MSLNTSMPYYRNSSREVKAIKEIVQAEAIKSARLLSRDKVKVKQNTSIGDLNRSKGKVNNSFYDNRNNSQIDNSNNLSGYLANAFQERKENIQRIQMQDITNKTKFDENKQREIKYLMRIAALEKESSKLTELATKLKKENQQLKQSNNQDLIIYSKFHYVLFLIQMQNQHLKLLYFKQNIHIPQCISYKKLSICRKMKIQPLKNKLLNFRILILHALIIVYIESKNNKLKTQIKQLILLIIYLRIILNLKSISLVIWLLQAQLDECGLLIQLRPSIYIYKLLQINEYIIYYSQ